MTDEEYVKQFYPNARAEEYQCLHYIVGITQWDDTFCINEKSAWIQARRVVDAYIIKKLES